MGMMMAAEPRPKIERKAGRVLIAVPRGSAADAGWTWWPEKNDLVVGFVQSSDADAIIASLDGKSESASGLPLLSELSKADGSFEPILTAFVDPSTCPAEPKTALADFCRQLKDAGVNRLDYRWGFDKEALVGVTRLVAPRPRKPLLAAFDQPAIDAKSLIPLPEGVDSFVLLSASPAKMIEALGQVGSGDLKGKIDDLVEKVKAQSRVDVDKDLLGNIGPKMALYLAPGQSAATTDEPPLAGAGGFDPMAIFSALQSAFPKPTLVAELRDAEGFGKALDAVMVAINKELRAQAAERAAEEASSTQGNENPPGGGPGQRPGAGRGGANAGDRTKGRRNPKEALAPEFRLMPGAVKTYMFHVPSDSPVKFGPPSFRPTIRIEGKYVAFSTAADSARGALEAAKKKEWKSSAEVEGALANLPAGLVLLMMSDPRETVPALLASLPGTLQAQLNTMIALAKQPPAPAGNNPAGPGPGMAGRQGFGGRPGFGRRDGGPPPGFGGSGGMSGDPRGGGASGGFGGASGFGGSGGMNAPGVPGGQQPRGPGGSGSTGDAMVTLKVDPGKLPKSEDLKAHMFPSTLAVAVGRPGGADRHPRGLPRHRQPGGRWCRDGGDRRSDDGDGVGSLPGDVPRRASTGAAGTGRTAGPGPGGPTGLRSARLPATGGARDEAGRRARWAPGGSRLSPAERDTQRGPGRRCPHGPCAVAHRTRS